jgi:hypothetical protein
VPVDSPGGHEIPANPSASSKPKEIPVTDDPTSCPARPEAATPPQALAKELEAEATVLLREVTGSGADSHGVGRACGLGDAAEKVRGLAGSWDALEGERDKARALAARLERVIAAHERSMYAALIDVTGGRHGVARAILTEALEGFDGPKWNGTGTGLQWLERTRAEAEGGAPGA